MQQQNFKDILSKMSTVEGWENFESENLLALKSTVSTPLINFVWGEVNSEYLRQVKDFFGANEFYWLLSDEQNQLIELKQFFSSAEIFFIMSLDLNYPKDGTNIILPQILKFNYLF